MNKYLLFARVLLFRASPERYYFRFYFITRPPSISPFASSSDFVPLPLHCSDPPALLSFRRFSSSRLLSKAPPRLVLARHGGKKPTNRRVLRPARWMNARALAPPPVLPRPSPVLPRCGERGETQEPRWRRPEQRQSATRRLADPVDYHKGGEVLGRSASLTLRGVHLG